MKTILITATLLIFSLTAQAGLKSPFASGIAGVELPNAHFVGSSDNVIRGMAPLKYMSDLVEMNISDVLIFKNQVRKEVDKEVAMLKDHGIKNIHHIPFRWSGFESKRLA